jgi:hypothetical protein
MQQRDTLTPLDARNSLLLDRSKTASSDFSVSKTPGFAVAAVEAKETTGEYSSNPNRLSKPNSNQMFASRGSRTLSGGSYDPVTPLSAPGSGVNTVNPSHENLVMAAAPLGGGAGSGGGNGMRQPTLPGFDLEKGGYNEAAAAMGPRGYGGLGGQAQGGYGQQQQQQQQQAGGYGGYGGYNGYRGPYARY